MVRPKGRGPAARVSLPAGPQPQPIAMDDGLRDAARPPKRYSRVRLRAFAPSPVRDEGRPRPAPCPLQDIQAAFDSRSRRSLYLVVVDPRIPPSKSSPINIADDLAHPCDRLVVSAPVWLSSCIGLAAMMSSSKTCPGSMASARRSVDPALLASPLNGVGSVPGRARFQDRNDRPNERADGRPEQEPLVHERLADFRLSGRTSTLRRYVRLRVRVPLS